MTKKMVKGVLKTWKEDRGFGFIKPEDGGKDIFIHISALKGTSRRPITGDIIYYQIAKDNHGKYKAVNAQIEGVSVTEETAANDLDGGSPKKWLIAISIGVIIAIVAILMAYN
ncbi:MAG: cold shock domain-containing protein [Methylococcales bacterium]|nr:cold shock domain-containing protein [Methylococcales bacterium]